MNILSKNRRGRRLCRPVFIEQYLHCPIVGADAHIGPVHDKDQITANRNIIRGTILMAAYLNRKNRLSGFSLVLRDTVLPCNAPATGSPAAGKPCTGYPPLTDRTRACSSAAGRIPATPGAYRTESGLEGERGITEHLLQLSLDYFPVNGMVSFWVRTLLAH